MKQIVELLFEVQNKFYHVTGIKGITLTEIVCHETQEPIRLEDCGLDLIFAAQKEIGIKN